MIYLRSPAPVDILATRPSTSLVETLSPGVYSYSHFDLSSITHRSVSDLIFEKSRDTESGLPFRLIKCRTGEKPSDAELMFMMLQSTFIR